MGNGIGTQARLAGLAVLAVDDHEINRHFIASALRPRVGTLTVACNGHQALELCRGNRFDIVLMDLHMPDLDGMSAWRAIRERSEDDGTRVIALTADRRTEECQRLRKAGFHGFLSKPVSVDMLLQALLRVASGTEEFVSFEQSGPPRTALLDIRRAVDASGSRVRAEELCRSFLPELASASKELEALLASGRGADAAAFIHRLRGAAGYVGAARLQEACRLLEDSLRRPHDSSPGARLVDLTRVIESTRRALEREIGST